MNDAKNFIGNSRFVIGGCFGAAIRCGRGT
jgi:hypothetical protein